MFGWLKRFASPSRAPGHRTRPALELLEPRLVPATTKAHVKSPPPPPSPPHFTVGVDATGNQHLFVLGLDNQVYEANTNPAGTPTSPYFLVTPGQVKTFSVTTDQNNNLHLFAIGLDDQVWQVLFNATGTANSSYFLSRGGRVQTLTAGRDMGGNPEIFSLGQDAQVYTLDFTATGTVAPTTPGYVLTAAGQVKSVAVSQSLNTPTQNPELFVIGLDDQVYEATAPSNVAAYNAYQLQVPGRVKALSVGPDSSLNQHLFVIGLDNQVYQALFDNKGNALTPASYRLTAPGQVKTVNAGLSSLSHPLLFVIGLDNQVYTLGFNNDGSLVTQTPSYVLATPGQVNALTLGMANGQSSLFAFQPDSQVYESVSPGFPAYQPYVLVATGKIK